MCGCIDTEAKTKPGMLCVGVLPCGHRKWIESKGRIVSAVGRRNTVRHAVWVNHDTEPFQFYAAEGKGPIEIRLLRLDSGQIREGYSYCGVLLPSIIAGTNGGHDWDRTLRQDKCINCCRTLGEL